MLTRGPLPERPVCEASLRDSIQGDVRSDIGHAQATCHTAGCECAGNGSRPASGLGRDSGPAPSSTTNQGLLEERIEFDVPDKDSRAPAVIRLEAKAMAPLFDTSVRMRCVRLCRSPFEWAAKVEDQPQGRWSMARRTARRSY